MFKSHTPNLHINLEKPAGYPDRFVTPEPNRSWEVRYPEYIPPYYIDPKVLIQGIEKGWADPEDISAIEKRGWSRNYEVNIDEEGFPLNPKGRTGIKGRGLLGKWGANYAVDILVSRTTDKGREYLLIKRTDNHQYAFVGGMVDGDESDIRAAERELGEEVHLDIPLEKAEVIEKGYANDFRNTDNAWIETTVFHMDVTNTNYVTPRADDDAESLEWVPEESIPTLKMHSNHHQVLESFIKNHARN